MRQAAEEERERERGEEVEMAAEPVEHEREQSLTSCAGTGVRAEISAPTLPAARTVAIRAKRTFMTVNEARVEE